MAACCQLCQGKASKSTSQVVVLALQYLEHSEMDARQGHAGNVWVLGMPSVHDTAIHLVAPKLQMHACTVQLSAS